MTNNAIEEEVQKKKRKKLYIAFGIAGLIVFTYIFFHTMAIMANDRRITFSEALDLDVFLQDPLLLTPVTMNSVSMYLAIVAGIGFALFQYSTTLIMKKHDNPDTVNGDAHFMTKEELEKYDYKRADPVGKPGHDGPYNMILSKDIRLSLDGKACRRNANVLCIGGSGAGKSRFFAAPNILQYNSTFCITDPSGELLNDYGKALENNGYQVKVFNIEEPYHGSRYNPFHYIHDEQDVYVLVKTIMANTSDPNQKGGDQFWDQTVELLLNAIVLYIWNMYEEKDQTFATVLKLINMSQVNENDDSVKSPLDILFDNLESQDPDNLAVYNYKAFKQGAGKTLKSVIISAIARLFPFSLPKIVYLTSKDEFDFDHVADTKQAIFIIIPTGDKSFNFLASTFYTQLFMRLYGLVETNIQFGWKCSVGDSHDIIKVFHADRNTTGDVKKEADQFAKDAAEGLKYRYNKVKNIWEIRTKKTDELLAWRGEKEKAIEFGKRIKKEGIKVAQCPRQCPNHVRFILDEFANIGQIPAFSEKLATVRKYDISCDIILQSKSQLKTLYKDDDNSIIGNCDIKLFLGSDDFETQKWLSDRLGEKTTTVMSTSWSSSAKGGGGSTSYNKSKIALLPVNKVAAIKDDECVVQIRAEMPYYGKKYELTMHPNYYYAHKTAGTFVIVPPDDQMIYDSRPLRVKYMEKQAAAAKQKEAKPEQKVTKEKSKEEIEAEIRKKEARKRAAEAALAKLKSDNTKPETPDGKLSDEMADAMNNMFNATPGMSPETIKRNVSEKINLRRLDNEEFSKVMLL